MVKAFITLTHEIQSSTPDVIRAKGATLAFEHLHLPPITELILILQPAIYNRNRTAEEEKFSIFLSAYVEELADPNFFNNITKLTTSCVPPSIIHSVSALLPNLEWFSPNVIDDDERITMDPIALENLYGIEVDNNFRKCYLDYTINSSIKELVFISDSYVTYNQIKQLSSIFYNAEILHIDSLNNDDWEKHDNAQYEFFPKVHTITFVDMASKYPERVTRKLLGITIEALDVLLMATPNVVHLKLDTSKWFSYDLGYDPSPALGCLQTIIGTFFLEVRMVEKLDELENLAYLNKIPALITHLPTLLMSFEIITTETYDYDAWYEVVERSVKEYLPCMPQFIEVEIS